MDTEKKKCFSHCKSLYHEYIVCLFMNSQDVGYNVIRCDPEVKKYNKCIKNTKLSNI